MRGLGRGGAFEPSMSHLRILVGGRRDREIMTPGHAWEGKQRVRQRWLPAWAAVCVASASLALPETSYGVCGDYVIYRRPDSAHMAYPATALSEEGPLPARRCHGPLCEGSQPTAPVPPPPPPIEVQQHPLALLASAAHGGRQPASRGGWPGSAETPLDGYRPSLLRPPCA